VRPARAVSAVAAPGVHPVDQLRQLPGLDRDQRSQRHRSAVRRARTCTLHLIRVGTLLHLLRDP
jgi:hypothetical protein